MTQQQAAYDAGGTAVGDKQAGLGNPRTELLSLRTVSTGTKTCQLGAGWRRDTDTHSHSGAKSSAPSLCIHTHTCTLICVHVHNHTYICVKSYSHPHTPTHMYPSPYTELSWKTISLSGIQTSPSLTEAASRTMGQESPAWGGRLTSLVSVLPLSLSWGCLKR